MPRPRRPLPDGEVHYRGGLDFSGLVNKAHELRNKQTPAEAILWELLRDRRLMNFKFRRQHQIGDYIADFYCRECNLVVELDGPVHDDPPRRKHDHQRDAYLRPLGLTILRFPNDVILTQPETILRTIASATRPSPPPLPR